MATRLSGKDMGSISTASSSPKAIPLTTPSVMRFTGEMVAHLGLLLYSTGSALLKPRNG
jgi:hypothetical protein